MHSRQSRMLILPRAWLPRKGRHKDEPDTLYNEVEKLSSRVNADRVMTEAFRSCELDSFDLKKINEKIDDALRIELKKLREEKKNEQLSCNAGK